MSTVSPHTGKTYLSCAETAKLVRAALKKEFPGAKFSVRSSTYSGGASIHVSWTDGPTSAAVDEVVGPYAGADFDGMIDLKIHNETWLLPDGTVTTARGGGGGSTIPEFIADAPSPNATLVHLGSDYVLTQRTISPEWRTEIVAKINAAIGADVPSDERSLNGHGPVAALVVDGKILPHANGSEYPSTLVWQFASGIAK